MSKIKTAILSFALLIAITLPMAAMPGIAANTPPTSSPNNVLPYDGKRK